MPRPSADRLEWLGAELHGHAGTAANGLQAMLPLDFGSLRAGRDDPRRRAGDPIGSGRSRAWSTPSSRGTAATTSRPTAPTPRRRSVTQTTPAAGATGVRWRSAIQATFSEALDPASISSSTFALRDAGGNAVAAQLSYSASTLRATLQPAAPLAGGGVFTATLAGGASGTRVTDLAGNALAQSVAWSFTTASGPPCPCSIWPDSAIPAVASENDPSAVELGVKFRSDMDGFITGIRFYKGPATPARTWATCGRYRDSYWRR